MAFTLNDGIGFGNWRDISKVFVTIYSKLIRAFCSKLENTKKIHFIAKLSGVYPWTSSGIVCVIECKKGNRSPTSLW